MHRGLRGIAVVCVLMLVVPASAVTTPAATANTDGSPVIHDMLQQVNESMVFHYLDTLMSFGPRYTGSENCSAAAHWIHDEFTAMGLHTRYDEWSYAGFTSQNVVATLNGSEDGGMIILSAHYDCTPGSLGADDDGSGIAAMMAAARLMSQHSFDHTVRFIAFSGEKVGTYGSFCYAREAYRRGDHIRAVVNLDMVGYANSSRGGSMVRMFSTERTQWLADMSRDVAARYPSVGMSVDVVPNYRGADHQAFLDYGYDAAFYAHIDGYPWANSPGDTPDHLNHTYQVKATKYFLTLTAELAMQDVPLQVRLTAPLEGQLYLAGMPLLPLDAGRLWFTGLRGTTVLVGSTTAKASVSHVHDIQRVIFCIDDRFISWDSSPPYEWRIQGKHTPPLGRHTLRVVAYDEAGNVAVDEMDISIVTVAYQYAPWS